MSLMSAPSRGLVFRDKSKPEQPLKQHAGNYRLCNLMTIWLRFRYCKTILLAAAIPLFRGEGRFRL